MNLTDIPSYLKSFLPTHLYSKGQAKSFDSLIQEIEQGESSLIWESGKPVRLLKVARVKVYAKNNTLSLWESRQVFADGQTRERGLEGLSEKFLPDESPKACAIRAINEEMGIETKKVQMYFNGTETQENESPSYPGLLTRYEFYDFKAFIPAELWQEQYVEQGKEKTTYFVWREIETT